MRAPVFAVLAAFAILAGCAPIADGGPTGPALSNARQCFNVDQVTNFRQGPGDRLFIRVLRSDVYELGTIGGCFELDSAIQLALIPDGGLAGTRLCTDDWARIVVPGSGSNPGVCRVEVRRALTAEEVAALPASQQP
jgi:hypothetical protein